MTVACLGHLMKSSEDLCQLEATSLVKISKLTKKIAMTKPIE